MGEVIYLTSDRPCDTEPPYEIVDLDALIVEARAIARSLSLDQAAVIHTILDVFGAD